MKMKILSLLFLSLAFLNCNKKDAAHSETQAVGKTSTLKSLEANPKLVSSDSFKIGLGKVYTGYVNIGSALANDSFAAAKEAFQAMHGVLHSLPEDGFDSISKKAWDSLDASFMEVLHPMAASENIASMRDHFIDFSPLILKAIETFSAKSETKAFLYHCPMARNNQGADWLQADQNKRNPYFGKTDLNCGDFKREISL